MGARLVDGVHTNQDPGLGSCNFRRAGIEKMKALVLAGGFPQIDLIVKLKERGIVTILADYFQNPVAKEYADKFYRISTLDVDAIKEVANKEHVDFIITVCTDQALLTMAKVSEELGLPCYLSYETARNVTNKAFMKDVFTRAGIPTAKHLIISAYHQNDFIGWAFPLIVKPVDCNSSKGVHKVEDFSDLENAIDEAILLSRTNSAIVEEYISGKELSVDVYVENGKALVLDITTSEKLIIKDRFVIFRTWHPARISNIIRHKVLEIAQQIADAFKLDNCPMLIQMLTDGENVYVIEFSARTGGGVKHLSIYRRTGVDVISAVIDLQLGKKPHIQIEKPKTKYMIDEYIYCKPGVYDHLQGFEELKKDGTITDFYTFRWKESVFDSVENSGDRIGGFTIEGNSSEELKRKHKKVNSLTKVISITGKDMMRHDLLYDLKEFDD